MALLKLDNISRRFGGILALDAVSLEVAAEEIVGLIGPNGAGKTTAFNVITRLYRPDSGDVLFADKSLLRTPPHKIIRRGIARTFQNVELFSTMTVLENVRMGFVPEQGTYRGMLPPVRSAPVDLRIRVITRDKRVEIPIGP